MRTRYTTFKLRSGSLIPAGRSKLAAVVAAILLLGFPGRGTAQVSETGRCSSGDLPRATLGITTFVCRCTLRTDSDRAEGLWTFHSEPEIVSLAPAGAAAGILEEGDRVVAIDGNLITTSAGGERWSSIRPGEEVRLRVRREGGVRDVVIRAGSYCSGDSRLAMSVRDADRPLRKRLLPRGWIGIGLVCDCMVDAGQEDPLWTFHTPPEVSGVIADGPAARAGLRPGDRLLRINGLPLDTAGGGRAFSSMAPGSMVSFLVEREGRTRTVEVVAEQVPPGAP